MTWNLSNTHTFSLGLNVESIVFVSFFSDVNIRRDIELFLVTVICVLLNCLCGVNDFWE